MNAPLPANRSSSTGRSPGGARRSRAATRSSVERRRFSAIESFTAEADETERQARDAESAAIVGDWSFASVPVSAGTIGPHGRSESEVPTGLGDGRPLPEGIRPSLETRLGVDLGAVRVHDDGAGADLAARTGAEAVTIGTDVAFAPGRFDPTSTGGRSRLGHELTHVVQQSKGRATAVGMRDGKGVDAPVAPPTTLETQPEADRKRIQVVSTTSITVPGIDEKFSTKGGTSTSAFPADTTMVFDASVDAGLQRGLKNVAGSLTAGAELTPAPLAGDATVTLELDLSKYGAKSKSLYRFTLISPPVAKGKKAANRIVVEALGAATAPAGMKAPAPPKPGEAAAKDPVADKIKANSLSVPYTGTELDAVRSALDQIPNSHLAIVSGLKFARAKAHATEPDAAGNYDPKTHTVTMFDKAFASSQVTFKGPGTTATSPAARAIVHEIGHAVDLAPLRQAHLVREQAEAAENKLVQDYPGDKPNTWKAQNAEQDKDAKARIKARKEAEAAQLKARSKSGSRTVKLPDGKFEDQIGGATDGYRAAAKKDGPKAVSGYGATDWQENYAEAYSLYLTSPDTLRSLRPNTYAYLDTNLPK